VTTLNFNELLENAEDFEPLPPGEYDLFVETAEAVTASTGKDMIKVVYRVESGPKKGKKIFNNYVISPESGTALGFFFRNMAAHGLTKEWFGNNPTLPLVAQNLVNKRVRAKVGIRDWQGQDRNEIKAVAPPQGAQGAAGVPGLPGETVSPTQTSVAPPPATQRQAGDASSAPAPEMPF
jgi:hypothetical protein